jgi:hypothetical protein
MAFDLTIAFGINLHSLYYFRAIGRGTAGYAHASSAGQLMPADEKYCSRAGMERALAAENN